MRRSLGELAPLEGVAAVPAVLGELAAIAPLEVLLALPEGVGELLPAVLEGEGA